MARPGRSGFLEDSSTGTIDLPVQPPTPTSMAFLARTKTGPSGERDGRYAAVHSGPPEPALESVPEGGLRGERGGARPRREGARRRRGADAPRSPLMRQTVSATVRGSSRPSGWARHPSRLSVAFAPTTCPSGGRLPRRSGAVLLASPG